MIYMHGIHRDIFKIIMWQWQGYHLLHCLIVWQSPDRNKNVSSYLVLLLKVDWKKSLFGPCCWYFGVLFSTFGYLMKIYCRRLRNNCVTGFPHQLQQCGCWCTGAGADVGAQPPSASIVWQTLSELILYQAGSKITFVKQASKVIEKQMNSQKRFTWCHHLTSLGCTWLTWYICQKLVSSHLIH